VFELGRGLEDGPNSEAQCGNGPSYSLRIASALALASWLKLERARFPLVKSAKPQPPVAAYFFESLTMNCM
jgi:hypothetical protein